MSRERIDTQTFDGTITTGTNEVINIDAPRAEELVVLVDNGSTDGQPATYDMTVRAYSIDLDDYQLYDEVTGSTAYSHDVNAWGNKMQLEFNNQSSSDAAYRITVESYGQIS